MYTFYDFIQFFSLFLFTHTYTHTFIFAIRCVYSLFHFFRSVCFNMCSLSPLSACWSHLQWFVCVCVCVRKTSLYVPLLMLHVCMNAFAHVETWHIQSIANVNFGLVDGRQAGKQPDDVCAVHKRVTINRREQATIDDDSVSCSFTLALHSVVRSFSKQANMKAQCYLILFELCSLVVHMLRICCHRLLLPPSPVDYSSSASCCFFFVLYLFLGQHTGANGAINLISLHIFNYSVLCDVWNCNAHKIELKLLMLLMLYVPFQYLTLWAFTRGIVVIPCH